MSPGPQRGPEAASTSREVTELSAVPGSDRADDTLAERIADVVTAHPAVARLHGGVFGVVSTYLPGRRLVGVRIGAPGEPVELGVVARVGHPLPPVVRALRREVSALCGGVPVDITVADLDVPAEDIGPPASGRTSRAVPGDRSP